MLPSSFCLRSPKRAARKVICSPIPALGESSGASAGAGASVAAGAGASVAAGAGASVAAGAAVLPQAHSESISARRTAIASILFMLLFSFPCFLFEKSFLLFIKRSYAALSTALCSAS